MRTDDARKKQTEERLLACAKRRFLSMGYEKASLRDICKDAGVTTGALYFLFDGKEALLAAILDPFLAEMQRLWRELAARETAHPDTADENEQQMMNFIAEHRDEAIILLEKCSGSRYAHIREDMQAQMCRYFCDYYAKYLGAEPDAELMRILSAMRMHGYIELIRGDYTAEERLRLARAVGIHADAGTRGLIEHLKTEKSDACR